MASPKQLVDLYKIAVDEYRFEVKLNWDRTMYYMVFNTATLGVASGLLKLEQKPLAYLLEAAIFLVGLCTSILGDSAIRKGHEYYRRSIVKKTLIEDLLGLTSVVADYPYRHTLAVGTTAGQGEHIGILYDPDHWINRPLRSRAITYWLRIFLWLLAALNLAGLVIAIALFFGAGAQPTVPQRLFVPVNFSLAWACPRDFVLAPLGCPVAF